MQFMPSVKDGRTEMNMQTAPTRKNVRIAGRTTWNQDILYLGFSGAFIEFEAETSEIQITLCTDREIPEEIYRAWIAVYLDDQKEPFMRVSLTKPEQTFTVFHEPQARKVKLRLVKMSEAAFGIVGIRSIQVKGDKDIIPTKEKKHKLEFIGDSITCGYGNEGILDRDVFCTSQENPMEAYAVLTANMLEAEYQLVSWSGIGVITNWVPETAQEPLEEILMPELYQYRDLRLCEKLNLPREKWDYSEYRPELIVINLGTNDDSYVRKIADRQEYFGRKYFAFLEQVHACNPQAAILCILGIMGQNLCEEEAARVERFQEKYPDVKIDYLKLPEQQKSDGIGADSHPSKITHRKAAEVLTQKIKEFMKW